MSGLYEKTRLHRALHIVVVLRPLRNAGAE